MKERTSPLSLGACAALMLVSMLGVTGLTGVGAGSDGSVVPPSDAARHPAEKGRAESRTVGHSMALVHERAGWESIRKGAYVDANQAFARAAQLSPDRASVFVGLAYSHHLLGQYDHAVKGLERAIHLDINASQAHGLLGDLYARRGQHERAIHHYRLALEQHPHDVAIADRLDLARSAYRAELEFDRLYSAHFQVMYRATKTDPELAHRIADRLEEVYRQVGRAFSSFPAETFTVIVYPDREFWDSTESPRWVHGLFDGVVHLPASSASRNSQKTDRLLRHEYTHALADRVSAGRVPIWLTEGLALYFEGDQEWLDGAQRGKRQEGAVTQGAFRREFIALPAADAEAAYAQSYQATRRLIERHGMGRVRALLQALSRTPDFPVAFEAVLKVPYREFEEKWLTQVVGQRF